MMSQTKTVAFLLMGSWILATLFYYNNFNLIRSYTIGTHIFKSRKPEKHKLESYYGTADYLLNTPGCYIPNYAKNLKFIEAQEEKETCGQRAIFVEKDGYNIKFRIDKQLLKKHYKGSQKYNCCYRFVSRSTLTGQEDTHVTYSQCTRFDTGTSIKLKEEVVVVSCTTMPSKKLKSSTFYEDAYIILKKKTNESSWDRDDGKKYWNVLVLGMDTMSRARLVSTMPKTVSYFSKHGWLDYKGYTKVGYNTFPNLMSFLTGRKMSTVYHKCAKSMNNCNDAMIWSKFKNFGYITAYGEDFLRLPDTFTPYHGFRTPPTDHYMRPLFLTEETRKGNLVCTKQIPSAIHALNYALDFTDSYKAEKFFGMFWLNSYSHNLDNLPTLLDKDITFFLDKLNATGALSNTFIYFLSDHGLRYGKMRVPVESYYEERLPMFFMWVPYDFRELHAQAYYNLQLNQNRLTTPYDLHETLRTILQLSSAAAIGEDSEACPTCTSLFDAKSEYRTCASAGVHEKWCSCHNLTKVDLKEYGAARSIELAVTYIQNVTKSVETVNCTRCSILKLKSVLRVHMHIDSTNNVTKYVTAFEMSPGDIAYEASVNEDEEGFHMVQPTQTISKYNTRGSCVVHPNDRAYCVCEKIAKCK